MSFILVLLLCMGLQEVRADHLYQYVKTFPSYYYPKQVTKQIYVKPQPLIIIPQANSHCAGQIVCSSKPGDCVNGDCICNGINDCSNGLDEQHCPPRCDKHDEITCSDRRTCGKLCNGVPDCPSGEDEKYCGNSCFCEVGQYPCKDSKKCLQKRQICNGFGNCPLSDDEWECPMACTCGAGRYRCADGMTCIKTKQVCDGINDCPHRDDESSCPFQCFCSSASLICPTGNNCVAFENICESDCGDVEDYNCMDGADEDDFCYSEC